MNKVSVIIPCYNHDKYVQDAIRSAINQTYENKEIIVIDDGSNQATKETLNEYIGSIDLLITQVNKGVVSARNNGIAKATGKYILTLDADDYFHPDFLKKAVKILDENSGVGMVTCWASIKNSFGKETRISKPTGADPFSGLFRNNASASLLFRKKCWAEVNGYDRNMDKGFEDWEFTIAVGKKGWSIFVIPEILFNYRNIPNSRNKKARLNYPDLRRYVYKKHKDLLTQNIEGTIDNFLDEIGTQNFQIEKLRNSRNYRIWKTFKQMENKLKNIFENRNVRN